MDKNAFALMFQDAIVRALNLAELDGQGAEPVVEFQGRPNPPSPISVDEALDLLLLSSDLFYLIVDVMAFAGESNPPVLFVRPSGHPPGAYLETWDPSDLGPFRGIGPIWRPPAGKA